MAKVLQFIPSLTIMLFFSQAKAQDFWEKTVGLDSVVIRSLTVNSIGDVFAGGYFGIFRSTDDGDNWLKINDSLMDTLPVLTVAISPNGHIFAGTDWDGAFRSTDNGATWEQINNGFAQSQYYPQVSNFVINSDADLFAATNTGLYRSTNNGAHWTRINIDPGFYVDKLTIDKEGHIFAGAGRGGILRSTDNGTSWSQVLSPFNLGFSQSTLDKSPINTRLMKPPSVTCISSNLNGHIFAGFADIFGESEALIVRSIDSGETWSTVSSFGNDFIHSIVTHASGEIFASLLRKGMCRSTDNGETWSQLHDGHEMFATSDFTISPGNYIFVGTTGDVFRSVEPLSCPAAKGDLDLDGNHTLLDIGLQVNCVFFNSGGCNYCIADSNCDWLLSPVDVVALLRNIFLGTPLPC